MPMTVGQLRKRLETMDDDRWIYVYVGNDEVRVRAEEHGPHYDDGYGSSVSVISAPMDLRLKTSGAAQV